MVTQLPSTALENTNEFDTNLTLLGQCMALLDGLLRMAITRARSAGFSQDEYQGMYVDDAEVDVHLANAPGAGLWDVSGTAFDPTPWREAQRKTWAQIEMLASDEEASNAFRFLRLARAFNLSRVECELLLIALAPELDRRYERLYSFLQDDVTRRRPGVDLALNLLADSFVERSAALRLLTPGSPLIAHELLAPYPDPAQREPTFLANFLKVDPQLVNYVLGHDYVDPRLGGAVRRLQPTETLDEMLISDERRRLLRDALSDNPIFYFHGNYGAGMRETTLAICGSLRIALVVIDALALKTLATEATLPLERLMRLAFREARLLGGAVLIENWISLIDDRHTAPEWLMRLVIDCPSLITLSAAESWEPHGLDRDRAIMRLAFEVPEFDDRLVFWERYVGANGGRDASINLTELANKFRLTGGQIRDAVLTARDLAAWRGSGVPLTMADLYAGSRAQSNRKLSNLAQKIPVRYTWKDVVLPDDRLQQLREMCSQVQFGHRVYDEWGFSGKLANARGMTALFAGVSGTGKTMSADVIGHELGLDLYKIDLSTVVSKYIGETEKNLSSIFDEAAQSNAILFFDEADALFGKRSEVKDSHDRYANIEIGYLLQRMESYDGITILATNLRQNLDEAFTRRLDFLIDFPFPEAQDRLRIWQVTFPKNAPLSPDVDLNELAQRYRLAGGNIRNAVMASAFLAAADGGNEVMLRHILHAIKREYQKMGKLIGDDLLAEYGELD